MGKNFLKIRENVSFSFMDPALTQIKDDYEGAFKPVDPTQQTHPSGMGTIAPAAQQVQQQNVQRQDGLLVRIAATHSGIITRNNGFYLPDKMRKGSKSFTDGYPKPVLLHHEEGKDPVGRIVESGYIDTSGATISQFDGYEVKNKQGKIVATVNQKMIKDFVSDNMPFGQQVDVVRSVLRDSNLLEDASYEGLGHIQVIARITDQVAISKLLDGRYLTGSVGATTDKAVCSVCKVDWTDGGPCDHKPGGIYDDAKCFIIAGNLSYDEYSFVNTPADRHSQVLELNCNGNKTVVDSVQDYQGRIYEVNLSFPQYDSVKKEDEGMGDKANTQIQDSASTSTPETEVEKVEDASQKDSVQVVDSEENTEKKVEDQAQETETETTETENQSTEESIEDFVVRVLDANESLSDEDEVKLYDALWAEAEAAFEAQEWTLAQAGVETVEDAKLSTEKRNKLPKSSFCGPNRSFPVPDCAHVTAARRLVNRAKVSESTKSSILTCVNRKARAMGCDTQDNVTVPQTVEETTQDSVKKDNMNHSRVLRSILSLLEDEMYYSSEPVLEEEEMSMLQSTIKRLAGMVGKDNFTKSVVDQDLAVDPACEQQLLDELARQEDTMGDLRESLQATRKEYTALFQDMEVLQDQLVEAKADTRKVKESHLATMVALKDQKVEDCSFTDLSDSDLDSKLSNLSKEVDIVKITDKLGDGMSRQPTESLDDESGEVIHDNHDTNKISQDQILKIQEHYMYLRFAKGEAPAEAFLNQMKREGKLPQDNE